MTNDILSEVTLSSEGEWIQSRVEKTGNAKTQWWE